MKKNLLLFLVVCAYLSSCVVSGAAPQLSGNAKEAVDSKRESFIELNDGSIVEGQITAKGDRATSWALIGGKSDAIVGGQKYEHKSFVAIQEKGKYFRKFGNRMVERIVKGKINVYRQEFSSANEKAVIRTRYQYYLQKGDKEKIVYFDLKTLKSMVGDYQPAVALIDEYNALSGSLKRKEGDEYLDRAIAKYNRQ